MPTLYITKLSLHKIKTKHIYRNRVDHSGSKTIFLMTSEDTDWLKNNFGSEPDVAFPGYYGVEELPGSIKNEIINLKP